jgi:hypothetical protein
VAFTPIIADSVLKKIGSFEPGVQDHIARYIGILLRNASTLSQPAHALCPQMQMFDFEFMFQDMEYRVMLFFQYGSDENTIHIEDIDVMTI